MKSLNGKNDGGVTRLNYRLIFWSRFLVPAVCPVHFNTGICAGIEHFLCLGTDGQLRARLFNWAFYIHCHSLD